MSDASARRRRVRTGCLTCRSRKVKCDEARPFCYNCTRVNRACLYQSPQLSHYCRTPTHQDQAPGLSHPEAIATHDRIQDPIPNNGPFSDAVGEPITASPWLNPSPLDDDGPMDFNFITGEWGDLLPGIMDEDFPRPVSSPSPTIRSAPNASNSVFPSQGSPFTYFLSHVEPPFITPWDKSNWTLMKGFICQMAATCPAISTSIKAIETLYESLLESNGDTTTALPAYFGAKSSYLSLLNDQDPDIEAILIATFLLCCFEIVAQHETVSNTLKQKDALVTRLERQQQPWSPVCNRIICWLHLLHTKALHLGGRGLLSPKVLDLLQPPRTLLPLTSICSTQPSASDVCLQALQQSLFGFYLELQRISAEVSALNRHHRPRDRPEDELKVDQLSQYIEKRLNFVWQGRPWILDLPAEEISQLVSHPNALEDLVLLVRLCAISYYAEVIYHARGHGKVPYGSASITEARKEIRAIATSAREACYTGGVLHPAFLWPFFMYSAESTEPEDVDWALESLDLVSNALWSSSSIKELTTDLAKEQLRKGQRVDSRYFCIERFGILPPFI
jgi:hypothetical protein